MTTITVKNRPERDPSTCDYVLNYTSDDKPWDRDVGQLLIKLGQKLIELNHHEEWLSMAQVAAYARRYRLRWRENTLKAKALKQYILDYLNRNADIRGSGVKVEFRTEKPDPKRVEDLYFKFRRMHPDGTCH